MISESSTGTVVPQSESAEHDWQVEGATSALNKELEEEGEIIKDAFYASKVQAFRDWFEYKESHQEDFRNSMDLQRPNLLHRKLAFTKLFNAFSPDRLAYQLLEDYIQQVENAKRVSSGNPEAILNQYHNVIGMKVAEENDFVKFVYSPLSREYKKIIGLTPPYFRRRSSIRNKNIKRL